MAKKYDYKNYVYLRIPKEEYEDIIKNQKQVSYIDLEYWHKTYKLKNIHKTIKAEWANIQKKKKVLEKIYTALEMWYNGLFKDDTKDLTSYQLAKLAGVNYLTARKYWEEEKWKEKFKQNASKALKDLKTYSTMM